MTKKESSAEIALQLNTILTQDLQAQVKCGICYSTLKSPVVPSCGHPFCKECIDSCFKRKSSIECPICRRLIKKRSCVLSAQHAAVVNAYLQLARNFQRDLREATVVVPKEEKFLESQAVVATQQIADSPMRDYALEPQFAKPMMRRVLNAKRRLPTSSLCKPSSKLPRLEEEDEPSSPRETRASRSKNGFTIKLDRPVYARREPAPTSPLALVTEGSKEQPAVSMDISFNGEEPRKEKEEVPVQPVVTRVPGEDKEVQCDFGTDLLKVNIHELVAKRRADDPSIRTNVEAVFLVLPGLASILMQDQNRLCDLLGIRQATEPARYLSQRDVKPTVGRSFFVPNKGVVARSESQTVFSPYKIIPQETSEKVAGSQPAAGQSQQDLLSAPMVSGHRLQFVDPSLERLSPKKNIKKEPESSQPVLVSRENSASTNDDLLETQPLLSGTVTPKKRLSSPRKVSPRKEKKEKVHEIYGEPQVCEEEVVYDEMEVVEFECVPGTPSSVTPAKVEKDDEKENVDSFDADITIQMVADTNQMEEESVVSGEIGSEERRREAMVISISRLQCEADEDLLHEFRISFPSVQLMDDVTPECTHLVMMNTQGRVCSNRSLRYAFAIAYRCELLGRDWMVECVKTGKIVQTSSFTLQSQTQSQSLAAWQRSRAASRPLFEGKKFLLPPRFSEHHLVSRAKLEELIVACGGTVLTKLWEMNPPNAYIIFCPDSKETDAARRYEYDTKVPVVNADWVLDSVSEYRIVSTIDKYRVYSSQTMRK